MGEIMVTEYNDPRLDNKILMNMYRLRHAVFHDRLGWDVKSDNGMEYDEYDQAKPIYVLAKGENKEVEGCWRLLPTTGPYMLKDVFPQLLSGQPAPRDPTVWEISRVAVVTKERETGFGFSSIPIRMIQASIRFAQYSGIARYVVVTSLSVERMLRKTGLNMNRFGPPVRIGKVLTVANYIEMDDISIFALFGTLPEHAPREVA